MAIVRVMRGTRGLFIWGAQLLAGEMVTFIRNCSGHVFSGRAPAILLSEEVMRILGWDRRYWTCDDTCSFH